MCSVAKYSRKVSTQSRRDAETQSWIGEKIDRLSLFREAHYFFAAMLSFSSFGESLEHARRTMLTSFDDLLGVIAPPPFAKATAGPPKCLTKAGWRLGVFSYSFIDRNALPYLRS
jgi:hypothetical protein